MKRKRVAIVRVKVIDKDDPTKKTYATLMYLAQEYSHCRLMWHYPSETHGELYGLRSWYGYDWYFLNPDTNRWTYLCRSWNRVPTYTIKKTALRFRINLKPVHGYVL